MLKTKKIFIFFALLSIAWIVIIINSTAIRIGDGWRDYLVLKSLGWQLLTSSESLKEIWHPFVFPPLLLGFSEMLTKQGIDFLLANHLIWIGLFVFGYSPLARRLGDRQLVFFLLIEFIYINWPGPIDINFGDADFFVFANFYNRYLDALWGCVFVLYFSSDIKDNWSDLLFATFLLIVAYFSKLSYFAGYSFVFFIMAIFQKRHSYLLPIAIASIGGLAYEPFGGLVKNNLALAEARQIHRDHNSNLFFSLLKLRTIIPGLYVPMVVYFFNKNIKEKFSQKKVLGLVLLTFLVAVVQLGNYGDLGLASFFLLLMAWAFSNQKNLEEAAGYIYKKSRLLTLFLALPVFYFIFDKNGALLPLIKCTRAAMTFSIDSFAPIRSLNIKNIDGFYLPEYRFMMSNNDSNKNQNSRESIDYNQYMIGVQYSNLIDYIGELNGTVFVNDYISAFPVLSAHKKLPSGARSWIMPYEFSGGFEQYINEMKEKSDVYIDKNCNLTNSNVIAGTEFCAHFPP